MLCVQTLRAPLQPIKREHFLLSFALFRQSETAEPQAARPTALHVCVHVCVVGLGEDFHWCTGVEPCIAAKERSVLAYFFSAACFLAYLAIALATRRERLARTRANCGERKD